MTITVRDHRFTPRAGWTSTAVTYYDAGEDRTAPVDTASRHHADGGMSLAEVDAWITGRELDRGTRCAVRTTTPMWHRRTDGTYRAVVLMWGRWDVARSWHVDASHPRGLWSVLCSRGVIHADCQTDDAYAAWLMLGRVTVTR